MAAIGHRADGQLRLERRADLAHEDDVERRMERFRHLGRHRDTAARQSQDDGLPGAEVSQTCGEVSASLAPVAEAERNAGVVHRC
ncbi:hypothetical protein GCM10022293_37580 [Azospirillum formosense]